MAVLAKFEEGQGPSYLLSLVPSVSNPYIWKVIFSFMALELFFLVGSVGYSSLAGTDPLIFQKAIPCKTFNGPTTQTGHVPVYNANGLQV